MNCECLSFMNASRGAQLPALPRQPPRAEKSHGSRRLRQWAAWENMYLLLCCGSSHLDRRCERHTRYTTSTAALDAHQRPGSCIPPCTTTRGGRGGLAGQFDDILDSSVWEANSRACRSILRFHVRFPVTGNRAAGLAARPGIQQFGTAFNAPSDLGDGGDCAPHHDGR